MTIPKSKTLFVRKEDAKKRFPQQELVEVFAGIEGWVWTTEKYARKYNLSWHKAE